MEESGEASIFFQENEVVWAKIRGYPWWPAFLGTLWRWLRKHYLHSDFFRRQHQEASSQLGSSKLRKFLEYYATFYEKVSKNKKLKNSIEKAEQRLQENNENISVYERIRNNFKVKKRKHAKSQSKISSEDKASLQDIPELIKNKTHLARKNKNQQPKKSISKTQKKVSEKDQLSQEQENQQNSQIKEVSEKQCNLNNQKNACSSRLPARATRLRARQQLYQHQRKSDESDKQQEEEAQRSQQKGQTKLNRKSMPAKRGRKGRPKKMQRIYVEQASEESAREFSVPSQKVKVTKREGGNSKNKKRTPFSMRNIFDQQNVQINCETANINVIRKDIQRIRQAIDNRQQLIKALLSTQITTENIKQILDIGVTDILLDGTITKTIFLLLNLLKVTLLHKYFPQDNKHRKKHEKFSKQKRKLGQNQDEGEKDERQNDDNNQSDEDGLQKKNKQEDIEHFNDIRKKTILKLEKMLKKLEIDFSDTRKLALEIERGFQTKSEEEDIRYNKVAYDKMRQIKSKFQYFEQNKTKAKDIKKYVKSLTYKNDDQNQEDDQQEQNSENFAQNQEKDQEQEGDEDAGENQSENNQSQEKIEIDDQEDQDNQNVDDQLDSEDENENENENIEPQPMNTQKTNTPNKSTPKQKS